MLLRKKKSERNIVLKGFFCLLVVFCFWVGSFILFGKWEQLLMSEHVRDLMFAFVGRVLTETSAFFFSSSLSAMAHEHVHVRLWWSKCPDPRTY